MSYPNNTGYPCQQPPFQVQVVREQVGYPGSSYTQPQQQPYGQPFNQPSHPGHFGVQHNPHYGQQISPTFGQCSPQVSAKLSYLVHC